MAADSPDSPIEAILAQREALGLGDEQRQKLELADIDFRRRAIELLNQRQLLALEMRRAGLQSGSGPAPDAEGLAAGDALTVKLRQLWLHALHEARSLLSAEQLAKMPDAAGRLPGFDLDDGRPASADLAALVSAAVAARIKDSKVVEVEIAQAIADRLIGWAKTAAIITGIPLALLAVVLTVLGISNWTDFSKRIEDGKTDVATKIADAQERINKVKSEAESFQKEYANLKSQLGDIPDLKKDVSDLTDKVKRLECLRLDPSLALERDIVRALERQIVNFRSYFQSLGYQLPDKDLTVSLDWNTGCNIYYDGGRLILHPSFVMAPDLVYREYTNRVLAESNPASRSTAGWKVLAIWSGLADYFPCSYLGQSKIGEKFVELSPSKMITSDMKKRGYLRDMLNKRNFVEDTASGTDKEMHNAGEVWSGVFWEIRTLFGCSNQSAKCADADRSLLTIWVTTAIAPSETIDVRYARAIVESVRQLSGPELANNVRAIFTRRGLAL